MTNSEHEPENAESPAAKTSADTPAEPPKDSRATPPRGNPDRDDQSVDKGEEQLGRIAGN